MSVPSFRDRQAYDRTVPTWKTNFPPSILPAFSLHGLVTKLCLYRWDALFYKKKVSLLDQSYARPCPSPQQQMSRDITLIYRITVSLSKLINRITVFLSKLPFFSRGSFHIASITFYQPETTANQLSSMYITAFLSRTKLMNSTT